MQDVVVLHLFCYTHSTSIIDHTERMHADPKLNQIEELKDQGNLDKALELANQMLAKDPRSKDALFQIADIEYRRWEIGRAEKPIDFLLNWSDDDAMSYYIKWVLEMEKTNWQKAKTNFKKALEMIEEENPEILRCFWLCEYRLGHRQEGIALLDRAYEGNNIDPEIILNLVEISILEEHWEDAQVYINQFEKNKTKMNYFDRTQDYYDEKIKLFATYIGTHVDDNS